MYPLNKKAIKNFLMAKLVPQKKFDGMIFEC